MYIVIFTVIAPFNNAGTAVLGPRCQCDALAIVYFYTIVVAHADKIITAPVNYRIILIFNIKNCLRHVDNNIQ